MSRQKIKEDVEALVLKVCRFSSRFCMDNEDERLALSDVITVELMNTFDIRQKKINTPRYEIVSDGKTVWVNGRNGLLGRFGVNGVDVHRATKEQATQGECLFCTHEKTSAYDWCVFRLYMKKYHKIAVPSKYMPDRLKKEK
jgi:hypothetical protein